MESTSMRFGTLLKVRNYQEQKAQQELSQIRNQKISEEEQLETLDKKRNSEISDTGSVSKTRAADMQMSRAFIKRLSKEIQSQKNKIEDTQNKEDSKTDEVVERKQAKEMIQNLEDKYRSYMAKEQERKDQRLMDVLAQRTRQEGQ
jgi:flagellar export protein FliJ